MNQDNNQQRRQLPRRSSRGVRPQRTEEQKQEDNAIYNRLFGDLNQSSSSDESFENQLGLKPLQFFSANFANYNYGRGYHYFFNLDVFPRVENSPSYALDENKFKCTYSHDQQILNGTKLKDILNRQLIGLPSTQTTFGNKKSQDKNICHFNLFNIEDKKYHNHRLISKYKYILKNLQKLIEKNKIRSYTEIRRDVVMHQVCQKDVTIQRKKQLLESRIKILEERVRNMSPYWDWQDGVYYHFSQDQLFHNQVMKSEQKHSERFLSNYIQKRINNRKQYIQGIVEDEIFLGTQKISNAIQTWLKFQDDENSAFSSEMRTRLKSMPKIIQMFRKKQQLVIFPLFTFNLGASSTQKFMDPLIKAKLQKQEESCFYVYKSFIKRILKRQFICKSQEEGSEHLLIQEYTNSMKRKIAGIEEFYKNIIVSDKSNTCIDQLVEFEKVEHSAIDQQSVLLDSSNKTQINIKQLILLFFYRNISIALEQFIQYLNYDPSILKFMLDSNYEKFHYGLAKILHQPQFCSLFNQISKFAGVLGNAQVCPQFQGKFYFSFNQKLRVAYVWQQPESDDWQTEKDQDQEHIQQESEQNQMKDVFSNGDPKPAKRVKMQ